MRTSVSSPQEARTATLTSEFAAAVLGVPIDNPELFQFVATNYFTHEDLDYVYAMAPTYRESLMRGEARRRAGYQGPHSVLPEITDWPEPRDPNRVQANPNPAHAPLSDEDPRLPPRGVAQHETIDLHDNAGFAVHRLHVTLDNPDAEAQQLADAARATAAEKRAGNAHIAPEALVQAALESEALEPFSEGPRGTIFVIRNGREDLLAALQEVDEFVGRGEEGGGWDLLGVGAGGSEGRLYMLRRPGPEDAVQRVEDEAEGGRVETLEPLVRIDRGPRRRRRRWGIF